MMYNNKLAIAVKTNGKVLREMKDTAFIPFGSEYTLLIKNLNTVRVEVRVQIDGTDATDGTALVIMPNSEIELKRFIKNGNLLEGNAFKFIERSAGVEQHRGIGVEDGLIRVEYQFEKPRPTPVYTGSWVKKEYWEYEDFKQFARAHSGSNLSAKSINASPFRDFSGTSSVVGDSSTLLSSATSTYGSPQLMNASNVAATASTTSYSAAAVNDVGITVPGQVVDQKFTVAAWFPVEETKHVMVIKLLGVTESGQPVQRPVTVKAKPKCTTCGHVNKATAKFCSECGTSLTIL